MMIFESEILQPAKAKILQEDVQGYKERKYYENGEYMMKIVDLYPAFYLLAFGLTLSLLIILIEVFWYDCLRHVNWNVKRFKRRFYKA